MDRTRIVQVVANLVENAIFHTPEGGEVTVAASVISSGSERRARVSVADTGKGLTEEDLPLVFDRFYRVDPSRSRITGGVGLGLTIANQLVQANGGTIAVESTPGQGARFVFELPLTRSSASPAGGNSEAKV